MGNTKRTSIESKTEHEKIGWLINWVELSRYLAGNESSVSRNRIPKKYQKKVESLMVHLKSWQEENQL